MLAYKFDENRYSFSLEGIKNERIRPLCVSKALKKKKYPKADNVTNLISEHTKQYTDIL